MASSLYHGHSHETIPYKVKLLLYVPKAAYCHSINYKNSCHFRLN